MINADDLNGARTERLVDSISNFLNGNKKSHSGVRLIDELMVDIMGGLIPGVLFNFSLMVCFAAPAFLYLHTHHGAGNTTIKAIEDHVYVVLGIPSSSFGGWFWFAVFLTFLILSYIAGHIFYRSDINKADREDTKRRIIEKSYSIEQAVINFDNNTIDDKIIEILLSEVIALKRDIKQIPGVSYSGISTSGLTLLLDNFNFAIDTIEKNMKQIELKKKMIDNYNKTNSNLYANLVIQIQNEIEEKKNQILRLVLYILFPKAGESIKGKENEKFEDIIGKLSLIEIGIFNNYYIIAERILKAKKNPKLSFFIRKYFVQRIKGYLLSYKWMKIFRKKVAINKYNLQTSLLASYFILNIQNETGCSYYEEQGDYPYLNFYKYLLKRNELNLIQYVDWNPAGARTKNKINRMKIDVQLDYPDAYAIINKNESHIRMASSSWYVSRFITFFAWSCIFLYLLLYFSQFLGFFNHDLFFIEHLLDNSKVVICLSPLLLIVVLMYNLRRQIEKFIHYQRLREIIFTLYIYHKLNIIKKEAKLSSNHLGFIL